jgi:tetratricopeptide (TPR) repeat protein
MASQSHSQALEHARALLKQGRLEDANTAYHLAGKIASGSWPVCREHVHLLCRMDRTEDADRLFQGYSRGIETMSGPALSDWGVIRFMRGSAEDAITLFARALRANPPAAACETLANLGYALFSAGRLDESYEVCNSALRLNPDDVRPHYLLASIDARRDSCNVASVNDLLQDAVKIRLFNWVRFQDEQPNDNRIVLLEGALQATFMKPLPRTAAGTDWGIMLTFKDETWCGFARQTTAQPAIIDLPQALYLVQRRKWVRLPATGVVRNLRVLSCPPGIEQVELAAVMELNLSAEGAAVRTEPDLPLDAEVTLELNFDGIGVVNVRARVIRLGKFDIREHYSALHFIDLDDKTVDKIARGLHELQLSRKRSERQASTSTST